MKPRDILTRNDVEEVLQEAVNSQTLATITVNMADGWQVFKSRFLERDPAQHFVVLEHQPLHGITPPSVEVGQCVGISFRHHSRKVMFATVVEACGKFVGEGNEQLAAIRYRWPETMVEMQRRAYNRTVVPPTVVLQASIWPGGVQLCKGRGPTAESIVSGALLDLSCGGALLQLNQTQPPAWPLDLTVGLELQLPDGRPPVMLDAHYRGARQTENGRINGAFQFVGLELSIDGRAVLQRLARTIQKFNRMTVVEELRGSAARF